MALLSDSLVLFEFDTIVEARMVLQMGLRIYKEKPLHLDWWVPKATYHRDGVYTLEAWVRIVGLLIHL